MSMILDRRVLSQPFGSVTSWLDANGRLRRRFKCSTEFEWTESCISL